MNGRAGFWAGACIVGSAIGQPAAAAVSFGPADVLSDIGQYYTAPLRWDSADWLYFGGTLAIVGISHEFDRNVRHHFAPRTNAVLNGVDKNSVRDALPAVALIVGTGLYAALIRDSDGYQETWRMLEAGVLSTVTGEALTYAAGRKRPDATLSPNQWRAGGDSFPSVHASAAFAIGAVFAESGNDEYRWVRRLVGYGVATGTAYIRVKDNVHWLSDTVAGAALGIATARFVLGRDRKETQSSLHFEPQKDGWLLSYSVRTW